MKVKFVSKLNRMSEIVFLVLSKKNAPARKEWLEKKGSLVRL